ncbi:MAG: hypothetical protein JEZ08_11730 [Clostridiales bacterium]|nr:hypothetical protein [Clostridiales bacterium]
MESSIIVYVLSMAGYFLLLIGLIELMRRKYIFSHYLWLASLLTIPFWIGSVSGWFRWVKMLSVLIPVIILGFTRIANYEKRESYWQVFRGSWVLYFFYGVISLNILEATLKDLALGHYLNVLPGIILILTIPWPTKYWEVSKEKYGDILAYTTVGWSLLYTTWNACFVYGESPAYFFSSCCILLAAVVYPIIKGKPELYMTARIYSLIAHLIIRAIRPELFLNVMDASAIYNEKVLWGWGALNLVLGVAYLTWYAWQIKAGTYKTEILPLHESI